MVKLGKILFFLCETGPSAQGLGSYDDRFEVPTALDDDRLFCVEDMEDEEYEEFGCEGLK